MYKVFIFLLLSGMTLHAQISQRTKVVMGTFATLCLEKKHKKHFKNLFLILKNVDQSLSSFEKNSPVYRLNHNKMAKLDAYLYKALLLSKKYYNESNGYFDISVGIITKDLYRFGLKEQIPSKDELQNAEINFEKLHFNKNRAWLSGDIKIDLGGMGKGFAVDMLASYMREHLLDEARIALSGDIRCLSICKIDVTNPYTDKALVSFETKKRDVGVSTSGNYNRFVKIKKYNHLINPKTKSSEKNFVSITLISDLASSDLDAYATAASVMPIEVAYKFLDTLTLAYIVLQSDKELIISNNIKDYVTNLVVNYAFKE